MNTKLILLVMFIALGLCVWPELLKAEEDQQEQSQVATGDSSSSMKFGKAKKIKINFEDELVKGKFDAPDAIAINTRKNFNYKRLLKIRDNFNPEMDKSKNAFQK